MNLKEVIDVLLSEKKNCREFFQECQSRYFSPRINDWCEENGVTTECVEMHGGEGEGNSFWKVHKFTSSDGQVKYVKFEGWYESYDGAEYECFLFVKPQEVKVIQYVSEGA